MTQPPPPPPPPTDPPLWGPPPAGPYAGPGAPYGAPPARHRGRVWLIIALSVVAVLVVLGVIGAVVGSGKDNGAVTATSTATPDANGGQPVNGNGVSLTVPTGWKAIPLNQNDMQGFLDDAAKENPQLARTLSAEVRSLTSRDIKVFAVKTGDLTSGFAANVSVLTVDGAPPNLDAVSGAVKVQLTGIGATDVVTQDVTLPAGPALKATYRYAMTASGRHLELSGEQYYVLAGSKVAIVTLTTQDPAADTPALDAMARSLQLG